MCTKKAHDEGHNTTKDQTSVVKGHGHGQDPGAQGTLEQMSQSTASCGAIWITIIKGIVSCLLQLILLR